MLEHPSQGNGFTWGGMRSTGWIQSKLDRAFGNKEWFCKFPVANQTFLDKRGSDHRPVLVRLTASKDSYRGSFRFDKRFLNKPDVKEAIWSAWNSGQMMRVNLVSDKLRLCRKALSRWKRTNNPNALTAINHFQVALENEQSSNYPNRVRIDGLKRQLCQAYREEETFWYQKSKEKWIKEGDKNTKFFHASVNANRSKKNLAILHDVNGNAQRAEASKGAVAEAYFNDLFKSSQPGNFQEIFVDMEPRVSSRMNVELIRIVSKEDIKEAVFSIRASSAPGADGFTGFFFQKYWDIIGVQVTKRYKISLYQVVFPLNGTSLNYVCFRKQRILSICLT